MREILHDRLYYFTIFDENVQSLSWTLFCVPRVGIEPTLLAKYDFESYASTNSATEAYISVCAQESIRKYK